MSKLMHLMIMYHEVHRLHRDGFKSARIGSYLGLDRRTVKKYLAMSEEEFLDFKLNQSSTRERVLSPYEDFVHNRLEACPEASSAQVHDWLKEHFEDFGHVHEKTVFNFVLHLRNKYNIPKPFSQRDYQQVEELPFGKQAQVDFGEYNMTTDENKRKKVYFFSMVLARSRHKYVVFSERPFNTLTAIDAHEKCFQYFMGMPQEIVYDQDKLLLVNENNGDLILTADFRKYVEYRGFKLHFCRKADPQSKGKIENVIKYIKYNFLRGRTFIDIYILNGEAQQWLERTANAKLHGTTQKIPQQEWMIEREHLKQVGDLFTLQLSGKPYSVRKNNTIAYRGNFYQLPLGSYHGEETFVNVKCADGHMVIYDTNNIEIAGYKIYTGKGKLICNNNFKRDYSSKIDQLIDQIAQLFNDPDMTKEYLQNVREHNPRYTRDQLQLIRRMTEKYGMYVMNNALYFCYLNKIHKASDMESLAKKLQIEYSNTNNNIEMPEPVQIKTLNHAAFKIAPQKSNISDYKNLMN